MSQPISVVITAQGRRTTLTLTAVEADQLRAALVRRPKFESAAAVIEQASALGSADIEVEFKVAEDQAVIDAINDLQAQGESSHSLDELEEALSEKIRLEPGAQRLKAEVQRP